MNRQGKHITHLISQDNTLSFFPDYIQGNELEQFLQYYQRGQARPDAFFTEAAFAYIKQQAALNKPKSRSSVPAIVKAQEALRYAIEQAYEPELQLLYKKSVIAENLLSDEFEHYCHYLLLPVWEAVNAG